MGSLTTQLPCRSGRAEKLLATMVCNYPLVEAPSTWMMLARKYIYTQIGNFVVRQGLLLHLPLQQAKEIKKQRGTDRARAPMIFGILCRPSELADAINAGLDIEEHTRL